jgi:linoleoyl-CoA desaturase
MDDDINIEPYVRTNKFQKKYAAHRFQHWYVTFLYALTYLNWIGYADFEKYFTNKVGDIKFKKLTWQAHVAFWFGKLGFFTIAFVIPDKPFTIPIFSPYVCNGIYPFVTTYFFKFYIQN